MWHNLGLLDAHLLVIPRFWALLTSELDNFAAISTAAWLCRQSNSGIFQ